MRLQPFMWHSNHSLSDRGLHVVCCPYDRCRRYMTLVRSIQRMTWKVCCVAFLCGSVAAVGVTAWSRTKACFAPRPEDSALFGSTLAATSDYLAVGDSSVNRVTLFRRHLGGRWYRWQTITPPAGSEAAEIGSGFGSAIALDGNTLAIGARGTASGAGEGNDYRGAIFTTSITDEELSPLREISIPEQNTVGHAVSVSGDRLAIRSSFKDGLGRQRRRVLIADVNSLETTDIIEAPTLQAGSSFGTSVDLNDLTLVIGAPYDPPEGAAWIFALEDGTNEPYRIPGKPGSLAFAGGSVAQGDGFFAISSATSWGPSYTSILAPDRVPILLNMGGRLSSNGRSLSIAQVSSPDGARAGLVRVYDILRHGAPRLVAEVPNGEQAALGDDFVAVLTVSRTRAQELERKVCMIAL